jgi:hypothetical protein
MTEQEQKAFKMYGKVPAKNLLTKMQKVRVVVLSRSGVSSYPYWTLGLMNRIVNTLTREIT